MDRPFDSDGEVLSPQDTETSLPHAHDAYQLQHSQQHIHLEHDQLKQNRDLHFNPNQQPEPESLTLFIRGLRNLASRHNKFGGRASQRMVTSRLQAAAIIVQVRL